MKFKSIHLPVLFIFLLAGVFGLLIVLSPLQSKFNKAGVNPIYVLPVNGPIETYTGTVKKGSDLPEKYYCPKGFYLVSEPGKYLYREQTTTLLKVPSENKTELFNAIDFQNKQVNVDGFHPEVQAFCEALICNCDDYLLVDTVTLK